MRPLSYSSGIATPVRWVAGDYHYRWKAARLRFRRRVLALWPLWLALLAVNLAEIPARHWLGGATVLDALWNRLHLFGLGLAGAAALLIMAGLLIEAAIATSARTKRLRSSPSHQV